MDTDDLSIECYMIIVKAQDVCQFLKTDLGVLAGKCKNEKEYLDKSLSFIKKIFDYQEDYLDSWLLEDRLDDNKILSLIKYIKTVQETPENNRTYEEW